MRPSRKQDEPSPSYHISFSGDRVSMRHAPMPAQAVETLKQAVRTFGFAVRNLNPAAEVQCTFGDLAAAARKIYDENGDPRTAECLRVLDMAHKLTTEIDSGRSVETAEKPKKGFVLVHPENGIYLGNCMGLGFWSKLDPAGQECAVAFETPEKAREHAASWDSSRVDHQAYLESLKCVEVEIDSPDGEPYASVDACIKAGLDAWYSIDMMEPASPSLH